MSRPAHRLSAKPRTADIRVSEEVTFAGLLLSEPVLRGLRRAGFERPSPIQLRAIPLGRCAVDLIVQAKSGTGKTCVLAVLALEVLVAAPPSGRCRALVLAPTREVAVQVAQVITAIGAEVPGLSVQTLIGGLPLAQDVANLRRCNIAVGTPGRVRQLVDCEALNTDSVRLFVMDEADKLMEDAFVDDINFIYSTLPASKQMVALSATYPESLASLLARYMRSPTFVRLGKTSAALLGIRQYVMTVPHEPLVTKQLKLKLDAVVTILSTVSFTQCLVFSNHQTRAETLCSQLTSRGWPSAHLSSSLSQERRLEALAQLTSLRCRVLVTTDLGARGVDSEHADLVVQLDVPWDGATYLHRVGRAGRYGSLGAAVALVSVGEEERRLTTVLEAAGISPLRLPDTLPADLKTCDTDGWQTFASAAGQSGERNGHGAGREAAGGDGAVSRKPAVEPAGGGGDAGTAASARTNGHATADAAGNRAAGTLSANGDISNGDGGGEGQQEGRKIRVARRRRAPGPPSAEQRQDSARLEAAADGWARAASGRNRRQPTAATRPQPGPDRDRPASGDVIERPTVPAAPAAADAGGDSDSGDSFSALLEAYRRDQERQKADWRSGGDETPTGDGQGVEQTAGIERTGEREVQGGSLGHGSGPAVVKEGEEDGLEGEGTDLKVEEESDVEVEAVDKERLRQVLTKLNPKEVSSLTEEDLSTLVVYLKSSGGTDCSRYRKAVALVRRKGVYQVLMKSRCAGEIETSLASMMETLRVESAPVAVSAAAAASVTAAGPRRQEVRSQTVADVPASASAAANADFRKASSDIGSAAFRQSATVAPTYQLHALDAVTCGDTPVSSVTDRNSTASLRPVNLPDAGAATYTAPPTDGAAICASAFAAGGATADADEEVRQMSSREEDVAAFQRELRRKTAEQRAVRACRQMARRDAPAPAVLDSSSSEDTDEETGSEEVTRGARGSRGGGRDRRSVPPRRATGSAPLTAEDDGLTETECTGYPPESGTAMGGGYQAPWTDTGVQNAVPAGSWAQYTPSTHPGYQYPQGAPPCYPGYPGYWGGYPSNHPEYDNTGDGYGRPHHPRYTGGWGGYGPAWHPGYCAGWGQYGPPPSGRPGGYSIHDTRSWDDLLRTCYEQQTQYLAHMARFFSDYHRQQP